MIKELEMKKRNISAQIGTEYETTIKVFMRGVVYGYCTGKKDVSFSLRTLFGGENRNWDKTPLIKLYEYYSDKGFEEEEAVRRAGRDAGHLLKMALREDKYEYKLLGGRSNEYFRID